MAACVTRPRGLGGKWGNVGCGVTSDDGRWLKGLPELVGIFF